MNAQCTESHRRSHVEGNSETVRARSHIVMTSNEEATLKSFSKTPTARIVHYKTRERNTDYVFHIGQYIHLPDLQTVCCDISLGELLTLCKIRRRDVSREQQSCHDDDAVQSNHTTPTYEQQMKHHAAQH